MQITRLDQNSLVIQATGLAPITAASVTLILADLSITTPPLDPADAWGIGQALQAAARRAGFTPPPPA